MNRFAVEEPNKVSVFRVDDSIRAAQQQKLQALRQRRDNEAVQKCLTEIKTCAQEGRNLMPAVIDAAEAYCTLGEIADVLRDVFGEYR